MNDDLPDHPDLPDHDDVELPLPGAEHHLVEPELDTRGELIEEYAAPDWDESTYVDSGDVPDHTVQVSHDDGPAVDHDDVPRLEVSVTPADGLDWVDPDLLGRAAMPDVSVPVASAEELLADLQAAGDGDDTWESAAASDDPAIRALAAHWRP